MKYFLYQGERIDEEEFKRRCGIKPKVVPPPPPPTPVQPTLPKIKIEEEWNEKLRLDGVERVKTGKKRKKIYNFIGNREMSQVDYVKYLTWPPPLNKWDYSSLKSYLNTLTLDRVVSKVVLREDLIKMALYFKLYKDKDCHGASKEWLYHRLVELSRRKRAKR